MNIIIMIVIVIGLIIPTKTALHMFQQNRYELSRYSMWIGSWIKNNLLEILYNFAFVLAAFIAAVYISDYLAIAIMFYYFLNLTLKELKQNYIIPIVFTARVYRQIAVFVLLYTIIILTAYSFDKTALMYLLLATPILPYILIYLMHLITHPIEQFVKGLFKKDAIKKLDSHHNLIKIGITGSYGKTSSKNILHEILSEQFYSLPTPASFNTPMGITITIREDLKNTHQVFIAEMGADKVGDIVELSNFIRPDYAIVTSIGPQHLATFKSIENIVKEKMALVEKLPKSGVAIINKDNDYINNYQVKNTCKIVSYGINNHKVDYLAQNITYSILGSSFEVVYKDEIYQFKTRLLGEHNVLNILSAIALARELDVSWDKLVSAVSKVRFIPHRLELKTINGRRFIDNAFNSNPEGANMSLQVISQMDNHRFIITPGMIDLGPIQNEENYKFGFNMKDKVDTVILVGQNQTKPIVEGLQAADFNQDNIIVFDTVKQALAYVYSHATAKDIILLENDLPDAFSN